MIIDYNNKSENYFSQSRPEILRHVPKNATKVLDIGCGSGIFLESLKKQQNCETWGIEPDETSCKIAFDKIDVIIQGAFRADIPELESEKFDIIFFNDVLEHLISPLDMLMEAKKYLAPNGVVIASIPNILYFNVIFSVLKNRDWKYESEGTLDNTHLRFFTRKSAIRLFQDAGLNIVSTHGLNPTGHKKFNVLNNIFRKKFNDFLYLQFLLIGRA